MRKVFNTIGGFILLTLMFAGVVFVFSGGYHLANWLINLIF